MDAMDQEEAPSELLGPAAQLASAYLASLPDRPVSPRASGAELRAALGGPLPCRCAR